MFNNYPATYQPYQNSMVQPPMTQQMAQPMVVPQSYAQQSYTPQYRPKFDVVQGEVAANVYPVNMGEEVILYDMDNPFIYKKRRGMDGRLETEKNVLTRYEEEQSNNAPQVDLSGYIRREEVDTMIQNAVQNAVEQRMAEAQPKKVGRPKSEE